jgi:hypothetical protein
MTHEMNKIMKRSNREHLHQIWEMARNGNLDALDGEEKRLGQVMLEHKDQYHNQFEFADVLGDHEIDPDSEENPFLHVTFHVIVENQLEARYPIEVYQFFNAMRQKKVPRHETIHLIAALLAPLVIGTLKRQEPPKMEEYKALLKRFKGKKPQKIYDWLDQDNPL